MSKNTFNLFLFLAATLAATTANAQRKCTDYCLQNKAPIAVCNGAINAYNRLDKAAAILEERVACEQACEQ